jgi:hypothetical protein
MSIFGGSFLINSQFYGDRLQGLRLFLHFAICVSSSARRVLNFYCKPSQLLSDKLARRNFNLCNHARQAKQSGNLNSDVELIGGWVRLLDAIGVVAAPNAFLNGVYDSTSVAVDVSYVGLDPAGAAARVPTGGGYHRPVYVDGL